MIFLRTAKTGSTNFIGFCSPKKIAATDNSRLLSHENNKKLILSTSQYITLVRNPYYRAVSMWKHQKKGAWGRDKGMKDKIKTFEKFLDIDFEKIKKWRIHSYTHVCPITDYLGEYVNKLSYVLKLENLKEDIDNMCNTLKIKNNNESKSFSFSGIKNRQEVEKLLTEANMKIIQNKYKDDFINFNYSTTL